jgi:hypothetical protein
MQFIVMGVLCAKEKLSRSAKKPHKNVQQLCEVK